MPMDEVAMFIASFHTLINKKVDFFEQNEGTLRKIFFIMFETCEKLSKIQNLNLF
jgi:hypothetical protein